MLITKEQQEAIISEYLKSGKSNDEKIGFIDGFEKAMELVSKLENKAWQDRDVWKRMHLEAMRRIEELEAEIEQEDIAGLINDLKEESEGE